MLGLFKTKIGWLRIVGFCEGMSLLILIFVAMPLKYFYQEPAMTKMVGTVHGALFLIYILAVLLVAFSSKWKFAVTCKLLLASIIPFGTFYADKAILSKLKNK